MTRANAGSFPATAATAPLAVVDGCGCGYAFGFVDGFVSEFVFGYEYGISSECLAFASSCLASLSVSSECLASLSVLSECLAYASSCLASLSVSSEYFAAHELRISRTAERLPFLTVKRYKIVLFHRRLVRAV